MTRTFFVGLAVVLLASAPSHAAESSSATTAKATKSSSAAASARSGPSQAAPKKRRIDHSGKKQRGKASYYSRKFAGKKMADGTPMDPNSNIAASKTLPLGTKARVKNLDNGKTAIVEIRDRGPYVAGRTLDVTPKIAKDLGFHKDGVAPVEVTPIEVPQPDGTVKAGAAAG